MRRVMGLALSLALIGTLGAGGPPHAHRCIGALRTLAAECLFVGRTLFAQERRTPPGHYCAPPRANLPREAHACECHRVCVQNDDGTIRDEPSKDQMCLNYCAENNCTCAPVCP